MSLGIRIYKHTNYGDPSAYYSHSDSWRYYRVWQNGLGGVGNDALSSLHIFCGGTHSAAYLFQHNQFEGKYKRWYCERGWGTLDVPDVGVDFNDITSSILLVHRSSRELVLPIGFWFRDDIRASFDDQLAGSPARRKGEPVITWEMWPGWHPSRKFVELRQRLVIDVPNWASDYDAEMRYFIYFFLDGAGHLHGYVNRVEAWVESGIWSSKVMDELWPRVSGQGVDAANAQITNMASGLSGMEFLALYYLPGIDADAGHVNDDVTMVLVKDW